MSLRGFEARQEARRRAYAIAFAFVLFAGGAVFLSGFLARASKEVHEKLYRDPSRMLQRLAEQQSAFQMSEGRFAPTLADLERKRLITAEVAAGEIEGYVYRVASATTTTFAMTADPDPARIASTTHFYIDESHTVRAAVGRPATRSSDAIWDPRDARSR